MQSKSVLKQNKVSYEQKKLYDWKDQGKPFLGYCTSTAHVTHTAESFGYFNFNVCEGGKLHTREKQVKSKSGWDQTYGNRI